MLRDMAQHGGLDITESEAQSYSYWFDGVGVMLVLIGALVALFWTPAKPGGEEEDEGLSDVEMDRFLREGDETEHIDPGTPLWRVDPGRLEVEKAEHVGEQAQPDRSVVGELERLAEMRRDGTLSEDEFSAAKKKLLEGP